MAAAKKTQNVVVWVLIGLLVVGLAGFGVDGFLSQRAVSIGSVGAREIPAQDYARGLRDALRAAERASGRAVPLSQGIAEGLDAQVRAGLVTRAALDAEAARLGISVGDTNVMRTVTAIDAFRGPGGAFDRDIYRFALENEGYTPAQFEEAIRSEAARGILQAATAAGVAVPANLRGAILDYYASRRDVTVFALDEDALPEPLPEPDAAAVAAFHAANLDRFTAPEIRAITYAWVVPEMLFDRVEIDPAAVAALYEARAADYRRPERRLIERLVFPDEAAAAAAAERLAAGGRFEDEVAARGLTLDDTDMGDVDEAQLGPAGAAVFALTEPGSTTGVVRTALGPAIFRMNAILAAQEVALEEVADVLRAELAVDAARRRIADAFDDIEDLIAGGATIEDLAEATDLELGRIDWQVGSSEGIAAYGEFRTAAAAAGPDDFPELRTLSDGGLFVLRLDGVTPPAPRPLEEVRAEAEAGARAAALEAALTARATALAVDLAALGPDDFAEATDLIPDAYAGISRIDRIPGLPPELVAAIHEAAPGEPIVRAGRGQVFLALVTAVAPPDPEDAQVARLIGAIEAEIGGALAQDVFGYFARALEREAGIRLNQAAIDAVHANFR